MARRFILACMFSLALAANVRSQICGTAAGEPCSATQLFSSFRLSYLAETTSETSQGICSYLELLSPEIVDGQANFSFITRPEDGTQITSDTGIASLTENPDIFTVVFSSRPETTYELDLPYANYSACLVTRPNAPIGCSLWVYEGTAADTVEACRAGHAQVCREPIYSTYKEPLCGSGPEGSA